MATSTYISSKIQDIKDELTSNGKSITTQNILSQLIEDTQFISPNEPITPYSVIRVFNQIDTALTVLDNEIATNTARISLWDSNVTYDKDEVVLYFKTETKQVTSNVGKRTFAFILVSTKDNNTSVPNYDIVDYLPDFSKSNWNLINPMSYLLQDMIGMRAVVKEVFQALLYDHLQKEHNLIGSADIEKNLLRTDYQNLITPLGVDKMSVSILNSTKDNSTNTAKDIVQVEMDSNGLMKYHIRYSFDTKANPNIVINDSRYYRQRSPIWDESDRSIFSQKYIEDDMFSVAVNERTVNSATVTTSFTNLRYGTNVFYKQIEFDTPFLNDEYCVFFDTYGRGDFVFGYDKTDIGTKTEPTYDAIVSMPMLLNKTTSGFEIVLPIHTYFNSMQQYQIGVPWKNEFRLQVIGRYR